MAPPRKSARKKSRKAKKSRPTAKAKKPTRKKRKTTRAPGKPRKSAMAGVPFVTREDGSRFHHDHVCGFAIEPFVPLVQKLLDVWVLPPSDVDTAVHRLLNPGCKTSETAHYLAVGRELFEWGYYTEALDCLEFVLRVQPDDPEVLEIKIAAHENIGQSDEAAAWKRRLDSVRRHRPTGRYLLDSFTDALVSNIASVVKKQRETLSTPVMSIKLGLQEPGSIVPDELWLTLQGDAGSWIELDLSLTLPDTLIPWHADRLRDADEPLLAFTRRFELAADMVSWSDPARVPASLFYLELGEALLRVVTGLTATGVEIGSGCALAVGDRQGDILLVDRNPTRQRARTQAARTRIAANLGRFPNAAAIEEFAWMCYAQPERRRWLIELAG